MAVEALCPICGAVFSLRDDMNGKKVRCTKCEHTFTVGGEAKAREREEKEAVQSKPGAKKARDDDDDDLPRPKSKKKRNYRDDEDDDGRKSKNLGSQVQRKGTKSQSKDSGVPTKTLAIAGGALLALLLVCGGGGYMVYRLVWGVKETAENIAEDIKKNNPGQRPGGDLEMPRLLTDLDSPVARTRSDAAKRLAAMKVDAAQQSKVAKALEAAIENGTDRGAEEQAIRALGVWGTKENAAALVKVAEAADQPAHCKNAAIDLLVKSKDDRVVKTLALCLKEPKERGNAGKQLIALGPELGSAIEAEIADNLEGSDKGLKIESAKILGAVGTKASIEKLEQTATKALAAKQKDVAQHCNDAVAAIKARS